MSHDTINHHDATVERQRRTWGERGASLVEYALLLALIAVVCVGALTVLGTTLDERIEGDAEKLEEAGS